MKIENPVFKIRNVIKDLYEIFSWDISYKERPSEYKIQENLCGEFRIIKKRIFVSENKFLNERDRTEVFLYHLCEDISKPTKNNCFWVSDKENLENYSEILYSSLEVAKEAVECIKKESEISELSKIWEDIQ